MFRRGEEVIWSCIVQHFGKMISVAGWEGGAAGRGNVFLILPGDTSAAQHIKRQIATVERPSVGFNLREFFYQLKRAVPEVLVCTQKWWYSKMFTEALHKKGPVHSFQCQELSTPGHMKNSPTLKQTCSSCLNRFCAQ